MAEKLFSYADKQVMDEVGSGGGSGSGALIVHLGGTPTNITIDKTYNEIVEAANNGRSVMLFSPLGELVSCLTFISSDTCVFTATSAYQGTVRVSTFIVMTDNTVANYSARLTE